MVPSLVNQSFLALSSILSNLKHNLSPISNIIVFGYSFYSLHSIIMADQKTQTFEIPKTCKAGVVVNEGPDFRVEVQDVPVPECGMHLTQPILIQAY